MVGNYQIRAMNQQPQATIYEVPQKTQDGRTFEDIYQDLIAPFPPEAHKERVLGKNRNGKQTYWVYLPWQTIRQRLIEVVGIRNFIFETVGYWLDESGNPVVQVRLNILGVVKEGIGYTTSHESFKGNKSQTTYADAYKNAAEEFGIGAYLDDQPYVIRYLWQNATDEQTKQIAQKLAGQYSLRLKTLRQNAKEAQAQTQPKPPAQMPAVNHQQAAQVKAVREATKHTTDNILAITHGKHPASLTQAEFEELLKTLVISKAKSYGYLDQTNTKEAYQGLDGCIAIAKAAGRTDLDQVVINWLTEKAPHYPRFPRLMKT